MQQYFVSKKEKDYLTLMEEDKHHVKKVMRYKNGDQVLAVFKQQKYLCSIEEVDTGLLKILSKVQQNSELDIDVTLIYALAKGDKLEWVLQKSCELGVKRIVPLLSKRCVVKTDVDKFSKKKQRYQRILKEASEQCHRNIIPEITDLIKNETIKDYLSDYNVVAYEQEAKINKHNTFYDVLKQIKTGQSITIIVGCEGGFEQVEIDDMEKLGILPCSLGKRILRSETAPLYMLSVIGYTREIIV